MTIGLSIAHVVETLEKIPEEKANNLKGSNRKFTTTFGHLALYKEPEEDGQQASFISPYTTPGPNERATSNHKKANLGVLLGVYLPTIQHILGVTMFIRLFWVVGMAGLWWTTVLLAICCSCTLLTSISLSAVATNGVVESGGAYFIISRNLGAEFGSAVGILFYLANTVAASMYIVGGVEVLMMYIFPDMAIGGREALHDTDPLGTLYNNYRIYGTAFLVVQALIVAMGVKFVQLLAPVSLMCVILAILACFAGGIEKAITGSGQMVCSLDNRLIQSVVLYKNHNASHTNITNPTICDVCDKSPGLTHLFCDSGEFCSEYTKVKIACTQGFPGFNMATLRGNLEPAYMKRNEVLPGIPGKQDAEVVQDVTSTFFLLLAIYFPAVTGIMTGTNMSGDLRDPQRSIPSGTIAATVSTSIIYYALALTFAASIDRSVLRDKSDGHISITHYANILRFGRSIDNNMVVSTLAWPSPWVVTVGSFLSTFGAALQCLCSAPRLLQSIAKDDVIPILAPFARVTSNNEPFLGLLLTTFIAELAILLGAVDKIAEILDFFFLMCYAFVNMIAVLHSILKAPNWRPRFKYFHWLLSLMGAILCFFIMFASDWHLALIACAITFAIYKYVEWKGAKKEWGDGMRGLALTTAQYSLLKVEDKDPHPKNWRPQLLICLSTHWSKELLDLRAMSMLNLAAQLKIKRKRKKIGFDYRLDKGLAIACAFLKESSDLSKDKLHAQDIKDRLAKDMYKARLRGFAKTIYYTDDQMSGCVSALYQSIGIGGLRPNTVLLNWPKTDNNGEMELFTEKLIYGVRNDNCVLVAKGITDFPDSNERLTGFIDIWWIIMDGGILMLIAYLLKQHKFHVLHFLNCIFEVWRGCTLRIFAIGDHDTTKNEEIRKGLQKYIYMLRIDADIFMVNLLDLEVSDEVKVKTAELERRQQLIKDELRMVNLLDLEVSDEVKVKTAELERRQQLIKDELRKSRSRESSLINDAYNNDDTLTSRRLKLYDSTRSLTPVVININQDAETSFIDNPASGLYGASTASDESESESVKLNVHKMNTAVRLNHVILENSPLSQLVVLNLPRPPTYRTKLQHSYMVQSILVVLMT
ncbi:amino acid permease [Dictyocaulus viviparus]|uniref:Amino acid permease n=1 Tax=Dictyocaulus viviparus TaxID=29172 RepID=A0A0D8XZA3_DICVI|nr:amino acid permease [Dictyocaulus viviparus]